MARKPPAPPPQSRLELSESADSARFKIADRATKGEELRSRQPRTTAELESLKADSASWRRYNALLLHNLFSTDELEREYLHSPYTGNVVMQIDVYGGGTDERQDLDREISAEISCLRSILDRLDLIPVAAASANPATMQQRVERIARSRDMTRVFVVHGHDEAGRESVARFLERLGVNAVILHEQPNRGDTLIEKLERNGDVSFAVVLLTPDDEGRARGTSVPLAGRARQNVLLELGYFVGKLGRENVCALHKEGLELPSDWDGVAWVNMDARGAWRFELARELKHAGFTVDLNQAV